VNNTCETKLPDALTAHNWYSRPKKYLHKPMLGLSALKL